MEVSKSLKQLGIAKLKGTEALTEFIMILPFNIAKLCFYYLSTKFSFVLSSVPGPRSGFQFGDMKMKAISVLLPPGHGENHMGIT